MAHDEQFYLQTSSVISKTNPYQFKKPGHWWEDKQTTVYTSKRSERVKF